MRNLLNKYLTEASMIALTFSLNTSTANATCSPMPTCESLEYYSDEDYCEDHGLGYLRCPFDATKVKCIPHTAEAAEGYCESLGYENYYSSGERCPSDMVTLRCPLNYDNFMCALGTTIGGDNYDLCARLGYVFNGHENGDCQFPFKIEECPYEHDAFRCAPLDYDDPAFAEVCGSLGFDQTNCNNHEFTRCPFKENFLKCSSETCVNGYSYNQTTGACDVVYYSCEEAELGDIYYSDNTCTRNGVCGTKTVIGWVVDVENRLIRRPLGARKPWNDGTSNYQLVPAATSEDGEENTQNIVSFALSSGQEHKAAQYCTNLTYGGKSWFLPSSTEATRIAEQKIGSNARCGGGSTFSYVWTSNQYNASSAYWFVDPQNTPSTKKTSRDTICIAHY